jgi:hypothetical protein
LLLPPAISVKLPVLPVESGEVDREPVEENDDVGDRLARVDLLGSETVWSSLLLCSLLPVPVGRAEGAAADAEEPPQQEQSSSSQSQQQLSASDDADEDWQHSSSGSSKITSSPEKKKKKV